MALLPCLPWAKTNVEEATIPSKAHRALTLLLWCLWNDRRLQGSIPNQGSKASFQSLSINPCTEIGRVYFPQAIHNIGTLTLSLTVSPYTLCLLYLYVWASLSFIPWIKN